MSPRFARPAFSAASRQLPRPACRSYAAAASVDSKPPIALFGVDGTYANALVGLLTFPIFVRLENAHNYRTPNSLGPTVHMSLSCLKGETFFSPKCHKQLISSSYHTVHRRRQILDSRFCRQIPDLTPIRPKIRPQTLPHLACAHPDRIGQIVHRRRVGEAHGRRRQGRDRQELPADAGGE